MDITFSFLTPERFSKKPQIALSITQDWPSFCRWLTWPSYGTDKPIGGAWCPCALEGGIVKGGTGPISLLVGDVDECTEGAIDRHAIALRPYAGAIIPTFSATRGQPKHRIVLLPSRSVAPDEFPLVWTKMATSLEDAGIPLDRTCKNRNRLYFSCVTSSPETWLGAHILTGSPIDVDAMLYASKIDQEREAARQATRRQNHEPVDADTAIARAVAAVKNATAGDRHLTLLRRAYSLALDGVDERKIAEVLLPAFVEAAGRGRQYEGKRAIRDAVDAARGAA